MTPIIDDLLALCGLVLCILLLGFTLYVFAPDIAGLVT